MKNFPESKLIADGQYYLAAGYFSQEDYSEAKNLLEDFIQKFPQHELIAKANYLYGKCFFNDGNYSQAEQIFKNTLKLTRDKDLAELIYMDIGNTYLNLGQFDNAKKIWEDLLQKYPDSQYAGAVILYLGGLSEKNGDDQSAEKYYTKAAAAFKNTSWASEAYLALSRLSLQKKDFSQAEDYLNKIIQQNDEPLTIKAKLNLAKVYTEQNDFKKALSLYDDLIKTEAAAAKIAILEKANLLKDNNDYKSAVDLFRQAAATGLDSPKLRFSLGFCLEKINLNQPAIEEYLKTIYSFEKNPYIIKAYFRIAKIYESDNNISAAKEIYQRIAGLDVEESKIAQVKLEELNK
jgi:TolA-binding protein